MYPPFPLWYPENRALRLDDTNSERTTTVTPTASTPTLPLSEGWLFQWLRWRLLANSLQVIFDRSLARIVSIFLCSLVVWGTIFTISYFGFRELRVKWDYFHLDGKIIGSMFYFMFVSLMVFLTYSSEIILYASLFRSKETAFLLSSPLREDQIFAYKFQGAIAFSSWAFILLGSPVLIAYGLNVNDGAPWYFYVVLPFFFLGAVLLPGSLGALICILLVKFVPKHRKQLFALSAVVLVVIAVLWFVIWMPSVRSFFRGNGVQRLLVGITMLRDVAVFKPALWISEGFRAAALGEVENMFYYLLLVWSNGLVFYLLAAWVAKRMYRSAYNRVATGGSIRRRYGSSWLDTACDRALFFLRPQTRLLIIKDLRNFRRDPAQWAQVLIILGLGVLFFSNVRRFYQHDFGRPFQNGICLLNLVATAILVCAYTGRFVFPMLSLEGRKFWILGLLPLDRSQLVWGKFAFSAATCLFFAVTLVFFSTLMLGMPWAIIALHVSAIAVISLGLSGLAVGLGACMPDFRESDPSKIVAGFGGTLNLIAGLLMVVVVIGLAVAPWHLVLAAHRELTREVVQRNWWLLVFTFVGLFAGLCSALVPMRAGVDALRKMEF